MIIGRVNARLQSIVSITIRGPQAQEQTLEARVDSGFNGWLTLPPDIVTQLGLPAHYQDVIVLANGEQVNVVTYQATLLWDDNERTIPVFATGDFPLLGMKVLVGYRICLDMVDGGTVTIERIR